MLTPPAVTTLNTTALWQKAILLLLVMGLGLTTMGSSCLNPCEQLADKICSCEPTEAERQACKRQASIQKDQREIRNEDRIECQKFMTTCQCRALEEGKLEACGLSRD